MEHVEQLKQLGSGGYASVHLCRYKPDDESPATLYALKRIRVASPTTPQQLERLRTEQLVLETLESPFLCHSHVAMQRIVAAGTTAHQHHDNDRLLAMEFIDGRLLYECVWHNRSPRGRLSEPVAQRIAAQLVLALKSLHGAGIVHRDVKSGNVLIDQRTGNAKLIDFGFAKQLRPSDDGRTRSFCGTHYIMAPEVAARRAAYDQAVDWWSLGVVVYEIVTGHPPWPYKPAIGQTLDAYFAAVQTIAMRLQTNALDDSRDLGTTADESKAATHVSPALQSFLRGLLTLDPAHRLGVHGATEVMAHPWFVGIDWSKVEALALPQVYDPTTAYDSCLVHTTAAADELSSAESIDPEDDAKYFGDF